MMAETRQQHWTRRGRELNKMAKANLCTLYRKKGGLGGTCPPEKWRKDELVSSIIEMEWDDLPEGDKLPDPPSLTPPCDECGKGQNATAHRYGGDHHYAYTVNPEAKWVPESEAEAERLAKLAEPKPDPLQEEGCQAEFIDGSWYGDDCPECRERVSSESDECEQCAEDDYCPKHVNGIYG